MKTITLVANNRPHYLERLIESLKCNNTLDYHLFVGVEPVDEIVIRLCKQVNFLPVHLTINTKPLGVAWNPFHTLKRAFDAGSEFNVHLEDDLLLAPDALDLANWFNSMPDNHWFCLNLFNYKSDLNHPSLVEASNHFVPLGWCIKKNMWNILKPLWMCDPRGWDFSMNKIIAENNYRLIQPKWSRSNHIGREGGTHCQPSFHDQVFSHLNISDGRSKQYYFTNAS